MLSTLFGSLKHTSQSMESTRIPLGILSKMVKTGVLKPCDDSWNPHTWAISRTWRAPNEPVVSPRRTDQVSSNNEGMAQQAGSLHSSSSHSSGPGWSRAEWPQADALALSPDKRMAPSVTVPPVYLTPGIHPSQDQLPGTDPVSGDQIAVRFNQLEHHQNAANRHSDESMR